eukprot:TRINITY_DN25185_c0_g1_i1.p1 TRINITY_DN25185_c0_g1~~TRINITY_DN25185_c0_g1_i1.p1  ORF type:complete len:838 (-),score=283.23 TRINITY_DN25185_c0_g1_i1:144-2657(-)
MRGYGGARRAASVGYGGNSASGAVPLPGQRGGPYPQKGRSSSLSALASAGVKRERADDEIRAVTGVHAQKIAALLASRNKLQCENAQLLANEREHRQGAGGARGLAFAKAETEIARQDLMIEALTGLLGKGVARAVALAALEAGPKRLRATTRLELRWSVEDAREELLKVEEEIQAARTVAGSAESSRKEDAPEIDAICHAAQIEEQLSALGEEVEEVKKDVAELESECNAYQVEIDSYEEVLQRGLELIEQASYPAPAYRRGGALGGRRLRQLEEQLSAEDAEYLRLHRARVETEQQMLKTNRAAQELQMKREKLLRELGYERDRLEAVKRDASVVAHAGVLAEKRKQSGYEEQLSKLQSQLKTTRSQIREDWAEAERRRAAIQRSFEGHEAQIRRNLTSTKESEDAALKAESEQVQKDLQRAESRTASGAADARTARSAYASEEAAYQQELAAARSSVRNAEAEREVQASELAERRQWDEEDREVRRKVAEETRTLEVQIERSDELLKEEKENFARRAFVLQQEMEALLKALREQYPLRMLEPEALRPSAEDLEELREELRKEHELAATEQRTHEERKHEALARTEKREAAIQALQRRPAAVHQPGAASQEPAAAAASMPAATADHGARPPLAASTLQRAGLGGGGLGGTAAASAGAAMSVTSGSASLVGTEFSDLIVGPDMFKWGDEPEKYDAIAQNLSSLKDEVAKTHAAIATRRRETEDEKKAASAAEASLPSELAAMRAAVAAANDARADTEAKAKADALGAQARKAQYLQNEQELQRSRHETMALDSASLELEQKAKRLKRQIAQADWLLKAPAGTCPCCQRRCPPGGSA